MAQQGTTTFPYVMVGACVIAVFWGFGHLWVGVAVVLTPVLLFTLPALLGMLVIAAFMVLAAIAYLPVLAVRFVQTLRSHA